MTLCTVRYKICNNKAYCRENGKVSNRLLFNFLKKVTGYYG